MNKQADNEVSNVVEQSALVLVDFGRVTEETRGGWWGPPDSGTGWGWDLG